MSNALNDNHIQYNPVNDVCSWQNAMAEGVQSTSAQPEQPCAQSTTYTAAAQPAVPHADAVVYSSQQPSAQPTMYTRAQPGLHTWRPPLPTKVERGRFYLLDQPTAYEHEPELIRDLIPYRTVGFLGGQSGAGKSFLAIEIAMCVMTGVDFAGHKVEKRGGVIIVAAEGEHTLKDRILARRSLLPDPNVRLPLAVVDGISPLLTDEDKDNFGRKVNSAEAEIKQRYGVETVLIIVDTVTAAGMIEADKENDQGPWSKIFSFFGAAAKQGATVMLVHHMGKNAESGLRGSSAARAGADYVLALTCDRSELTGLSGKRTLALTKSRNGKEGPIASVALREVQIGCRPDGSPVNSAVLDFVSYTKPPVGAARGRPPANAILVREAFNEVSLKSGKPYNVRGDGPEVKSVFYADLLSEFEARSLESFDNPTSASKACKRKLDDVLTNKSNGFSFYGKGGEKKVWQTMPSSSAVSDVMKQFSPLVAA